MPLPNPTAAHDSILTLSSSQSIATTVFMPILKPGRVKDFAVSIGTVLGTANQTFQLSYAPPGTTTFTNVTDAVVTMPFSGSAAGNVQRVTCGVGAAQYVQDGGVFRITSTGGGSGAIPLCFAITITN